MGHTHFLFHIIIYFIIFSNIYTTLFKFISGINNLTDTLKYTQDRIQNLNISSTHFDVIKNFNDENKNSDIKSVQEKLKKLTQKIDYAKQTADMVIFFY